MSSRGRPPKFTPELATRFCEHIAAGTSRNRAAALVGIDAATVYRWLARSRAGGGRIYASFAGDVARAEAEFIARNLRTVVRAAQPRRATVTRTRTRADGSLVTEVTERVAYDWAAARWLLETRDRESFGPHRQEIAAIKKELRELRKRLATGLCPAPIEPGAAAPTSSSAAEASVVVALSKTSGPQQ